MGDTVFTNAPSHEASFYDTLPKKHVAAGCLFRNDQGHVLLVKPTYTERWELPGGVVEESESPFAACCREVEEELGLQRTPGALLVVDYRESVAGVRGDALRFLFDGGLLTESDLEHAEIGSELSEWRFVPPDQVAPLVIPAMAVRIAAALDGDAHVRYLEEGNPPGK